MDDEQNKLVYRLHKKGKDQLTDLDKLIIESDPEIKKELSMLFDVDKDTYDECNRRIESALVGKRIKRFSFFKGKNIYRLLTLPAAACLMLVFFLLQKPAPVSLGGGVSLFLTNTVDPNTFYVPGSLFQGGDEISIGFQAPVDSKEIRQGVLFSVSGDKSSLVHYRYDSTQDRLDQSGLTIVDEKLTLPGNIGFVYFIVYFSSEPFIEQEIIDEMKGIIDKKKSSAEKSLSKRYKSSIMDVIYLIEDAEPMEPGE